MIITWRRAALLAALLFVALFALRLLLAPSLMRDGGPGPSSEQQSFENSRKNYASAKQQSAVPTAAPAADVQKYEKIATLAQASGAFDDDKTRMTQVITAHQGIVQLERQTGLTGRRSLFLGIGVPPDKFEAFIDAAKAIGRNVQIDVVKNDKTNDYLQLKAKRTTLEKARAALEGISSSGGSVDERVNVQNRLTEIEEKIQELGVSLGEFDTQNELCTVNLTLTETRIRREQSLPRRLFEALEWTAFWYAATGVGFLTLTAGIWLAAGLVRYFLRLAKQFPMG
jgi:Domain of unknown function (DUF4349)